MDSFRNEITASHDNFHWTGRMRGNSFLLVYSLAVVIGGKSSGLAVAKGMSYAGYSYAEPK